MDAHTTVTTPLNATHPLPESTPIKPGTVTMLPFTTNQKFYVQAIATEIKSFLLGPMPAQNFLDEFFPITCTCPPNIPQFTPGCFESVLSCKTEPLMYDPFVGHFITSTPTWLKCPSDQGHAAVCPCPQIC
jgi:hypothetical protein